jgi:NAD(P)-dependent dehydrogenase (short-subunit alcohol dehydrogenase family)
MHAVILGASKGCGYHALVRILALPEWTATILLRKPEPIESDNHLKKYLADGRLKIVKGDATSYEDIKSLFDTKVDVVISTIGASHKCVRADDRCSTWFWIERDHY